MYNVSKIAEILNAHSHFSTPKCIISNLIIDSRSINKAEESLFFALNGHRDGHNFIEEAYKRNIRNFVISDPQYLNQFSNCNFFLVDDVLNALQDLCAYHRSTFNLKTIGITGSNGKTIVKEWLFQLLSTDFNIVRSPKSYNSQIGVPLSVWKIDSYHNLAIFEAGISKVGEMENLTQIIQPTIGVLTHLGDAHDLGFVSEDQKIIEKLKLFKNVELFIFSPDYTRNLPIDTLPNCKHFSWSFKQSADLQILLIEPTTFGSKLTAKYKKGNLNFNLPFRDKASIENAINSLAVMLALSYSVEESLKRLMGLNKVSMRLELKTGINQCSIIDDSYSADISSLAIALDFLNQQNQHDKNTVILSDLVQTGKNDQDLYSSIAALLAQKGINRIIGIGTKISTLASQFEGEKTFYQDTESFLRDFKSLFFYDEAVLVKGARQFEFEKISRLLVQKIHDTILEVDLNAMIQNLQYYRSKLKPKVKIMAMVKAFSYGSGSFEIANLLQHHKVDYLTVAYADEGIALRDAGITLPIMVMSVEESAFEAIIKYNLEPEIFSLDLLEKFVSALNNEQLSYPIHIKIDSGMHRLGFSAQEITELACYLKNNVSISVKSIFSHLVGSDDSQFDDYSKKQIDFFNEQANILIEALNYKPLLHICNTSAISRIPSAQMDMVRLGIGLYGFDPSLTNNGALQTVMTLKTTVTQVKEIGVGETIGYSRNGILPDGGKTATVKIGYADGYSRAFGNGVGKMLINGVLVPTIGSVCMDMTILDVSKIDVKAGDEVIVFNNELTIAELAKSTHTIPYEILTSVSQRVKRVYLYE